MRNGALHILLVAAAGWLSCGQSAAEMVVFREILYHPQAPKPEYIVLENLTSTVLDIADWQFTQGVHFHFPAFATNAPAATLLKAHERIVVCGSEEPTFRAAYHLPATLRLFGPWTGNLANEGERITLRDKNGVVVCSLKYASDGAWPAGANGTGHSLLLKNSNGRLNEPENWSASPSTEVGFTEGEQNPRRKGSEPPIPSERPQVTSIAKNLPQTNAVITEIIHPAMDNQLPSGWRAIDQGGKAPWQTFACTNIYRELNPLGQPGDYRELHLQLAGAGHVALQNLALLRDGTNCLVNSLRISTNGAGDTGWLCQGTHWASFITNSEFHLVSDGRGDDRANRVEIDVPALEPNATYVLRFDARWIAGKPRLIAQSWDRSISGSFLLERAKHFPKPGQPNANFDTLRPQADHLRHSPAVPGPHDRVTVSARILSAAPFASVELLHRSDSADNGLSWASQPMFDDGSHGGDVAAGDGIYTGELNDPKTNGQTMQFFVRVTNKNGQRATLPESGPDKPGLFVVDDRSLPRDFRTMRLVLSARDLGAIADGNSPKYGFHFPLHSSHYFNATLIVNEHEIYYGAEVRNSGSLLTRTGELRKPKLKLPQDHAFRGHTRFVYDDDAAEGRAYHNRVTRYLLYLLGHPVNQSEFVRLVVNAGPAVLREETEPVDHEFLDRNFADGKDGELYHISEDWSLLDNWEGVFKDADWAYAGSDDPAAYRNSWSKRTRETEDDYSHLIALFKALSQTNASPAEVERLLDVRAALKLTAVRGYVGDWDTFTMQRGRNAFLYRRPGDGKFQFLHWDGDEGFISGQPFYGERVKGWIEQPQNRRVLYYYLLELTRLCSQSPDRLRAWLEAEREAAGKSVFQASYLNFFKKREAEVLRAMEGKDRIAFEAHSGRLDGETGPATVLSGRAPYGVLDVRVEGHPEAKIEWISDVRWQTSELRVPPGESELLVRGLNETGQTVAQSQCSVSRQSVQFRDKH